MLNNERFALKVVPLSMNAKTGPMAATYRPVGDTCPSDCFFLNNGCYAQRHHTGMHARKSGSDYHELNRSLASGASMIRHHVSGDFFKNNEFDREYFDYVLDFHRANRHLHGYAYTHRIADILDAGITAADLPSNFVLVASLDPDSDSMELRERVQAAGFKYARVGGTYKEAMADRDKAEVVCPNQVAKKIGKRNITCLQCKLCTHAKANVVFIKH